jgi:CRP-like cAMP-binding protein
VLLTIERVALLRRADFFSATPDRVLAGLAKALEEVEFLIGDRIIEEGAIEDWLFIVEHGEIEVVRPDRRVRLGAGTIVGELAVLDPQPRSATVVAMSPVRLLRLSKDVFDDAMRSRPEIASGVIGGLVRRLREAHDPAS